MTDSPNSYNVDNYLAAMLNAQCNGKPIINAYNTTLLLFYQKTAGVKVNTKLTAFMASQ